MKLSEKQMLASKNLSGSCMVIAVPGAGKTTILLERIKNLIDSGIKPSRILTITFSKAAANELKIRFEKFTDTLEEMPHFYTIHAFSYIVLRDYGRAKGIEYKLLESDKNVNKYKLLSDFYRNINNESISEEKLDNLINKIGYIKNMMLEPTDFRDSGDIVGFYEIFQMYESYKKKYKYIDFDDMLELALKILNEESYYKRKYTNMYDFIQVDEGQDTSKLQMELIKLLTRKKSNLFIVADDDQSIYSFRGADPRGLFSLKDTFPDIQVHYMETNYRSSKNIVLAANNFIDQNKIRFDKILQSSRDFSAPIEIVKLKSTKDQYDFILKALKNKNLDDCAILYRNNISSVGIIEMLEKNSIPFKVRDNSKVKFYSHRISKDLLNIIKFSENATSINLLEEIYYKMNGYISKSQINFLKTSGKTGNLIEILESMPGIKSYAQNILYTLRNNLDLLSRLPMNKKIEFIGKDLKYLNYVKESARRLSLSMQTQVLVFETLKDISIESKDLISFEGRLKFLDRLVNQSSDTENAVSLSTIHSAKGKEYKYVYIIDLYDGMFPNKTISKSKDRDELLLEEERRLFYVGMTRAKDELTLLIPSYVAAEEVEISAFVKELAERCI